MVRASRPWDQSSQLFNVPPCCGDLELGCGERRMARCGGSSADFALGLRRQSPPERVSQCTPSAGLDAEQELGGTTTQMAVRRPRSSLFLFNFPPSCGDLGRPRRPLQSGSADASGRRGASRRTTRAGDGREQSPARAAKRGPAPDCRAPKTALGDPRRMRGPRRPRNRRGFTPETRPETSHLVAAEPQ